MFIDVKFAKNTITPPLIIWWALLLFGSLPSIIFSLNVFLYRDGQFLPLALTWWGRDFSNLYLGGHFAVAAGIDVYDQSAYIPALQSEGIFAGQNYSYPPATLAIG